MPSQPSQGVPSSESEPASVHCRCCEASRSHASQTEGSDVHGDNESSTVNDGASVNTQSVTTILESVDRNRPASSHAKLVRDKPSKQKHLIASGMSESAHTVLPFIILIYP